MEAEHSQKKKEGMDSVTELRIGEAKSASVDRAKLISLDESDTEDVRKREAERREYFLNYKAKETRPIEYRVLYESTTGGPQAVVQYHAQASTVPYHLPLVAEGKTGSGASVYVPLQYPNNSYNGINYYMPAQATYRIIVRKK